MYANTSLHGEDGWFECDRGAVVLDGLGGHHRSDLAVAAALDALNRLDLNKVTCAADLLQTARNAVVAHGQQTHSDGSAAAAAVWWAETPTMAWIGDCRGWSVTGDTLTLVTDDHDALDYMVGIDRLDYDESRHLRYQLMDITSKSRAYEIGGQLLAEAWANKHMMYRDLRAGEIDQRDLGQVDYVILTSDGVHDNHHHASFVDCLNYPISDIAQQLVNTADEFSQSGQPGAKPDDITAIVSVNPDMSTV